MKNARLNILSKDDMDKIHATTLQVMQNPGILIKHDKARELCKKAGCDVDDNTMIVKFPPELVEECLKKCPKTVNLYSRNGKKDVPLLSDGSYSRTVTFGIGTEVTKYLGDGKFDTKARTLKDLGDICHVVDACDNLDMICAPVSAMDYATAPVSRTLREVDAISSNSVKPFYPDTECKYLDLYYEYEAAVYGGDKEEAFKKPFMIIAGCPTSPLQLDFATAEICTKAPEYGMPVLTLSMAMSAASSPIFLAGTLVIHNAEVLAGMVLTQLTSPGTPFVYGSSTTNFDLFSQSAPVGSPELALISSGACELAQYYSLPCKVAGL